MKRDQIQMPKAIEFTKEGYDAVLAQQEKLMARRPAAVEELRRAREMGDLSENGAYKAARFELSDIDRTLRRLTYLIRFGKVVEKTATGKVTFGSKVTINDGAKDMTFTLVGGYESNPKEQKLSTFSPIGKAVLGQQAGEKVIVHTPSGSRHYSIIKVC
jgi:transcription elongation factor GreA